MSGGVGPTYNDITLPEETHEHEQPHPDSLTGTKKTKTKQRAGFFSFRQLNSLAVMVVLSSSGMVSPEDFAFVIFSFIYMYFYARIAFPTPSPLEESRVFDPKNKMFRLYILIAAIIGLFLPIAYILEGIFEGDKEGIKAAAPHVFLLASQVFMEGVAYTDRFSIPIRVFVPVFYNSRRIFTLVDWLRSEFLKAEEHQGVSDRRLYTGRVLAVANMAIWCFNLFGLLLPLYIPRAFKKYYTTHKVD